MAGCRIKRWQERDRSGIQRRRIFSGALLALNGKLPYSLSMDALVERVTRKIAEAIHPDKIVLFGSRAKGTATEDSDIDLVVVYSGPKTAREVELEIEDLFFPRDFSMDVIVMTPDHLERYKKIANSLARVVSETGVLCYGRR